MRGILFGLLFSNIFYLGWGVLVESRPDTSEDMAFQSSARSDVLLVSEVDPERLRFYAPSAADSAVAPSTGPVSEEREGSRRYCAQIGPFENLADADGFMGTNAERFAMRPDVRQIAASPNYRVYLPPLASRELATSTFEALRASFAANNLAIDSFLITRGELANGIALGLFSEQRNALNVQAQLERLGYRVVIAEEEKFREEVWVLVSDVESESDFERHWAEIQLSRSYIQAGEKLCETIAHGV